MKMLDEIDDLKQSGFGRPQPRHGLPLLHWFVTDCLTLDQNDALKISCYPGNGDFGFHPFENRYDRNGRKLLPNVEISYYAVGNLGKQGAHKLPPNVRKHYNKDIDNSNKDRIIISYKKKCVHAVYVTEHSGQTNFNKCGTYQISMGLIMIIRGLEIDEFLQETGYLNRTFTIIVKTPSTSSASSTSSTSALMTLSKQPTRRNKPNSREEKCCCTIL